ncbi:DUF4258 domain-containing protein [Pararhodospirillum oryzae]|uniref:DUF4258 domain-containing protein n=1 Tax=Pararhodospirillum oryzae TaxID=478448 RepID=A0A512H5V6_9PROT|nr:DUF4258 domain-containing protein [Pararhodospirillum oryzae]GEO80811.1 hypothetical protein ROR02_09420 [Pararhodospirillum oryzae]
MARRNVPTPIFPAHTKRLHALVSAHDCGFKYTFHALEEMTKADILRNDVEYVLRRATVQKVEQNQFEETWNCVGSDMDERRLEIVVVAYEREIKIKIITAWVRRP